MFPTTFIAAPKARRIVKCFSGSAKKRSVNSQINESRTISVLRIFVFVLMLAALGCREKLRVERITDPEYPSPARYESLRGTVVVMVIIGSDGRVTYAKGSGEPEILVKAAEENARQWVFGPFPPV